MAVVPVKRLTEGKSRLAAALSPLERAGIMLDLVTRTVSVLRASGSVDQIALVTPEIGLPERMGVEGLPDRGSLNGSLVEGIAWARRCGADRLLIIPADLPLLAADDIAALAAAAVVSPGLVLAPTRDGGTGALLASPPDVVPPAFGPDSCGRHQALAEQRGVAVRIVHRRALAFDLDTVDDLRALQGLPPE